MNLTPPPIELSNYPGVVAITDGSIFKHVVELRLNGTMLWSKWTNTTGDGRKLIAEIQSAIAPANLEPATIELTEVAPVATKLVEQSVEPAVEDKGCIAITQPDAETRLSEFETYLSNLNFRTDDLGCIAIGAPGLGWKNLFIPFGLIEPMFESLGRENQLKNVYISMAPFVAGTTERTKENVSAVRHAFVDIDEGLQETVRRIRADVAAGLLPEPSVIIQSSPDRGQVIWSLDAGDFVADGKPDIDKHEGLLRALQQRYQTDAATTDTARVLRVPGFVNVKYEAKPIARLLSARTQDANKRSAFKIEASTQATSKPALVDGPIISGSRNKTLTSIGGVYRNKGLGAGEIYALLSRVNEERCQPMLDDSEVQTISHSVARYKVPGILTMGGKPMSGFNGGLPVTPAKVVTSTQEEIVRFAISEDEREKEYEKDFPVIPLLSPGGPDWDDSFMYGLCGDIIRKMSAYCEASPAGLYLDLLVGMGSIFGRTCHFKVGATKHYSNEYLARVGETSIARKGSGRGEIKALLQLVDPNWCDNRTISGFGSGQGIIEQIRDDSTRTLTDRRGKELKDRTIAVPGIADKRLCINENELANVFKLASMKDSRVDVLLRNGWDSIELMNIVKGRTEGMSNSVKCMQPHLSLSADTTPSELISSMPPGSGANGFANRFLYCYVYRTKICANSGPEMDWSKEAVKLLEAVTFAHRMKDKVMSFSPRASVMWSRLYSKMESTRPANKFGQLIARGPAHVRRLAMILAAIDQSPVIDSKHLEAARKIWGYCEDSVDYIFTGTTSAQRELLNWINAKSSVTLFEIQRDFFQRNVMKESVQNRVFDLSRHGFVTLDKDGVVRSHGKAA